MSVKINKTNKSPSKVVIPNARLSYAHLFQPQSFEDGGDAKYSVSCIISKDDVDTIAKLEEAFNFVKTENSAKLKAIKKGVKFDQIVKDGDIDYPDEEAYENSYVISAKSKEAPGLVKIVGHEMVDGVKKTKYEQVTDSKEIYSGCYAAVSINFYLPKITVNGICVGLNNVLKKADGAYLGGRASAEDDFDDVDTGEFEDVDDGEEAL